MVHLNSESAKLTTNALAVLESRYFLKDLSGKTTEGPSDLFRRVAKVISAREKIHSEFWEDRFFQMMTQLRFLPNSPTLMNAGKPRGQLSACFVLPVEDSLDSIFESLRDAAKIHQSGGGTGFSFSKIRPKGSAVRSSQGIASGPVSYIRIFDTATETIKQGGTRRGANMAILRVDHPDIMEFIESKLDHRSFSNFNISVSVTDAFMKAVRADDTFSLWNSFTQRVTQTVKAREVFQKIIRAAWLCGDPGLIFVDRINRFNPTPLAGELESTNPCGEQPLLPYESCNLGSLNLGAYFQKGALNWALLKKDVWAAVRFLDNVIDLNDYPVEACKEITLKNRKIGLGVMGFADLLLLENLSYASPEARKYGEKIMAFIDRQAKAASITLAQERGEFPHWPGSLWQRLGYSPLRNATVSTVAPTGTISMIAGASSGVEPIFSGVFYRNVLDGKRLLDVHPTVQRLLAARNLSAEDLSEARVAQELGPAWSPAQAVSVEGHVGMQAVFQRFSDSAVSKTINLPESATAAEIEQAYFLAYASGCKGITVYRDKSKPAQVLESGGKKVTPVEFCTVC